MYVLEHDAYVHSYISAHVHANMFMYVFMHSYICALNCNNVHHQLKACALDSLHSLALYKSAIRVGSKWYAEPHAQFLLLKTVRSVINRNIYDLVTCGICILRSATDRYDCDLWSVLLCFWEIRKWSVSVDLPEMKNIKTCFVYNLLWGDRDLRSIDQNTLNWLLFYLIFWRIILKKKLTVTYGCEIFALEMHHYRQGRPQELIRQRNVLGGISN